MTAEPEHLPQSWHWEAGSDQCPHGPEPADDTTEDWDRWMDRHQWTPQDVRICLDAPAGEACAECSDEQNEFVRWADCIKRLRAQTDRLTVTPRHIKVVVEVGSLECLDRECDDFFTEEGDEIPGKTDCSHTRPMDICEACSVSPAGDTDGFPVAVAWNDCAHRPTALAGKR